MENNEDYYFYVKVLPGYDAENISLSVAGMDTELKELTSNTIGYTERREMDIRIILKLLQLQTEMKQKMCVLSYQHHMHLIM